MKVPLQVVPAAFLTLVAGFHTPAIAALIGSCSITVHQPGKLVANANLTQLSSKQAGGSPVTATIRTMLSLCLQLDIVDLLDRLECFQVTVPPPVSLSASPAGLAGGVMLGTSYSINGGPERPGLWATTISNGTFNVRIDMTADTTHGLFPAGAYRGQTVIRCE
ncbi:MAG: hypothetical protein WBF87_12680 [Mesorhizobium sp.]